jgi:DNA-directed RNA polymerase beta' subunit
MLSQQLVLLFTRYYEHRSKNHLSLQHLETTKVLNEAAVAGKIDYLEGLKENVIVGHRFLQEQV